MSFPLFLFIAFLLPSSIASRSLHSNVHCTVLCMELDSVANILDMKWNEMKCNKTVAEKTIPYAYHTKRCCVKGTNHLKILPVIYFSRRNSFLFAIPLWFRQAFKIVKCGWLYHEQRIGLLPDSFDNRLQWEIQFLLNWKLINLSRWLYSILFIGLKRRIVCSRKMWCLSRR